MIIESCGCWRCEKCNGCGFDEERLESGLRDVCKLCDGYGYTKMCPEHAEKEGWLSDYKKRAKR